MNHYKGPIFPGAKLLSNITAMPLGYEVVDRVWNEDPIDWKVALGSAVITLILKAEVEATFDD